MKLDMHCHTKEGSIDAKVPIQEYITKLVKEGFSRCRFFAIFSNLR